MNSSQFAIRRSELEFLTPTPITTLSFSRSLETSGEKSESPLMMTKVSTCALVYQRSSAWTTMRMSAEFLPDWRTCGISISSKALVHGGLECLVALPVAVRLLHHDAALEQEPLEHLADVEPLVFRVLHAERDVLEVAEQRHVGDFA